MLEVKILVLLEIMPCSLINTVLIILTAKAATSNTWPTRKNRDSTMVYSAKAALPFFFIKAKGHQQLMTRHACMPTKQKTKKLTLLIENNIYHIKLRLWTVFTCSVLLKTSLNFHVSLSRVDHLCYSQL